MNRVDSVYDFASDNFPYPKLIGPLAANANVSSNLKKLTQAAIRPRFDRKVKRFVILTIIFVRLGVFINPPGATNAPLQVPI